MSDKIGKAVFTEDENGNDDRQVGWLMPASDNDAARVIMSERGGDNGRSDWSWLRMQNGDLMLVVFPRGDLYLEMSDKGVCDFKWSSESKS